MEKKQRIVLAQAQVCSKLLASGRYGQVPMDSLGAFMRIVQLVG